MRSSKDLKVILDHLDKYPLLTQKQADFELWKQIVDIKNREGDLTSDDLQKIVNIKASLNKGLSDELKAAFPDTKPVLRPEVKFSGIPDPHWLSGFVDAEGCFMISTQKSRSYKQGVQVIAKFSSESTFSWR